MAILTLENHEGIISKLRGRINEAELDYKNIFIPPHEYMRIVQEADHFGDKIISIWEHPVLSSDSGFVVWINCEYCHTTKFPENRDGRYACAKCGAPV